MGWISNIFKKKSPNAPTIPESPKENAFADISHYEKINFDKYKPKILITKATESTGLLDKTFHGIQHECKMRGIKFGAYHFFRCNKSAIDQAKFFCETVKEFDMPPILDLETTDGMSASEIRLGVKTFLDYVENFSGKIPIIYGGYYSLKDVGFDKSYERYPLWLARYTNVTPTAPLPWKEWYMWQFSDAYPFEGIGRCDASICKGDL